jgi:preprotein translocase subunit SecE
MNPHRQHYTPPPAQTRMRSAVEAVLSTALAFAIALALADFLATWSAQ